MAAAFILHMPWLNGEKKFRPVIAYEDTAAPATLETIVVGAKRNRFPLHFFCHGLFLLNAQKMKRFAKGEYLAKKRDKSRLMADTSREKCGRGRLPAP